VAAQIPADSDDNADTMLLEDGRLSVLRDGCYVTIRGTEIVLLHRRKPIGRAPLAAVQTLLLQGHGASLSAAVPLRLSEAGAAVILASCAGTRIVVLAPAASGRAILRAEQARRMDHPEIIRAGLAMLRAKISNQASVLRYFARYRKRTETELHARMVEAAAAIRKESVAIGTLDMECRETDSGRVRRQAMEHEGHAAALYWESVSSLIPAPLGFPGRRTRGAEDPVNQCLNYAYGILYSEVWRAVVSVGLDPCFGIIHGSEKGEASLVFGLIEEVRAPFADRLVISLCGRGFLPALRDIGMLRTHSRRILVEAFGRLAAKPVLWCGARMTLRQILGRQARALARAYQGNETNYRGFHLRW
jgi:CRISPR-associated protein Cas1